MSKRGNKYLDNHAKVDRLKDYDLKVATDLIKRQTAALKVASEEAAVKADSAGEKLRQQAEDLVNASDQAIARAREAGNVLHHQSLDLINVSQKAASRTEDITNTIR